MEKSKMDRIRKFMKSLFLHLCLLAAPLATLTASESGWTPLFDGETLSGWKANESPDTWSVVDGAIMASGPVSHLFYVGPEGDATFTDFELKAEVRTRPNTNSGIFFRQPWQASGWLQKGMEVQLQNSGKNQCYTGGLWIHAMRPEPSPVRDGEWFEIHIIAKGEEVTIKINGETTTEYRDAEEKRKHLTGRREGHIALQGHGPQHRPEFRNIRIKTLE